VNVPQEVELLQSMAGVAKDLTLTGFMVWFIWQMMTGKIVRREELDQANKRTELCEANSNWWRDRYLTLGDTTRESITTLKSTVEVGLAAIRRPG
jgi:hypothetical protein